MPVKIARRPHIRRIFFLSLQATTMSNSRRISSGTTVFSAQALGGLFISACFLSAAFLMSSSGTLLVTGFLNPADLGFGTFFWRVLEAVIDTARTLGTSNFRVDRSLLFTAKTVRDFPASFALFFCHRRILTSFFFSAFPSSGNMLPDGDLPFSIARPLVWCSTSIFCRHLPARSTCVLRISRLRSVFYVCAFPSLCFFLSLHSILLSRSPPRQLHQCMHRAPQSGLPCSCVTSCVVL